MEEADVGQVSFDGFVVELLLSKEADELAGDGLRSRKGLIAGVGAEIGIPVVAWGVGVHCAFGDGCLKIELNILLQDRDVQSSLVTTNRSVSATVIGMLW